MGKRVGSSARVVESSPHLKMLMEAEAEAEAIVAGAIRQREVLYKKMREEARVEIAAFEEQKRAELRDASEQFASTSGIA